MKKKKKKNSKLVTYSFVTFFILIIFLSILILFFGIIENHNVNRIDNEEDITYYNQIDIDENVKIIDKKANESIYNTNDIYNSDVRTENNKNQKAFEDLESSNKNKNKGVFTVLQNPQEKKEEKVKKSICIIIDDYGYQDTSSILMNLPFKISVSILPGLTYSKSGFEIFANSKNITPVLHIPMESLNPYTQSEKEEIKVKDNKIEIERKLELFFSQIPAKFANNHMGSKVSLSENTIKIILNYLSKKGIRFIDSHTINNSLFPSIGKSLGYPIFENNLFLDYNEEEDLPEKEFLKGLNLLKTRDFIIIIGHNTKEQTLNFLQKLAYKHYFQNYEFISIRELFERY